MARPIVRLLGIPIDAITTEETLRLIGQAIEARLPLQIATVNPEFLVAARTNRSFRHALKDAQLRIPDGAGLRAMARFQGLSLPGWQPARALLAFGQLLGSELALLAQDASLAHPLPETITGTDLVDRIAKQAAAVGWRLYLAGSQPGIAARAAAVLKARYPGLIIAGAEEGPPDPRHRQGNFNEHVAGFLDRVRSAQADVLFLAFGAPRQDEFLSEHRRQLGVPVTMGVGGAFDFISGQVKRAPDWIRSLGLEWLWRLIVQPWRLGRILAAIVVFPWLVLVDRQKIRSH
ncbi:WecB/TagA/CpsF family glycosyltransferase [Candidatus Berkelbacteria bacterium]|nr:WecB/TagA/CpsF family glycosyltransferase [Candidatus Berkelbacteria bacterium]